MSRTAKAFVFSTVAAAALAGTAGVAAADSGAQGAATHSPGVISGNVVQAPIHIPVNVCGNTVNLIGLLNPTFGNHCSNY
ncbi:chaplin [Streptomyces sp. CB01635]|uniref:chaplin n=1 Tax=unclassified Streptomyces TaxID=2593676 RepID=UPI000C26EC38|nr:chaplin [Streptomyces sp. CB01635]PJN08320.1 chaplin [Streptomyces sp. CB01635]